MGKTISEKILSNKSGTDAKAGQIVLAKIDRAMSHDGNRPIPLDIWKDLGGKKIFDPKNYILIIDHSAPSPVESISNVHKKMRQYAKQLNLKLFDVGEGVCHQIMVEKGLALPGELIIGSDSHTCTYGALNLFATGMGSTDIAMAIAEGKQWFRVPETIRIILNGELPKGVFSKDLILYLVGKLGADGANYMALEFSGEGLKSIDMEERFTISNMAVEMGAKVGIMEPDEVMIKWVKERTKKIFELIYPDPDAKYLETVIVDLSKLSPYISSPHQVENALPIE
ncbi:MAG: 3-isopropylmalate dehydratase large subunit, partial [Deltaproteobacteria bacterium]|nr:3-isopropylmalate dehydratase large subunit [Deltaproteobacteria bacterium]